MQSNVDNPQVSIVIPVYNGSNYLKQAIDSALRQTYKNIEIIVVNDGSTDGDATDKIACSYGNKIRYFLKKNGGVSSALNFGITRMTGDYFSWLSHDDLYEKNKIEEQIKCLSRLHERNIILATNVKVLFENGIKKKESIDAIAFNFIDLFLATSAIVGLNGCSLLIPKKAFEVCGLFDLSLPVTQDYDLWFRMKDKYKFILLDKHLVISRRHVEQDSVQKQKLLYEAGDKLHAKFLNAIAYDRFEEYFLNNKTNISHTYENYKIYKLRGYKRTAPMILKNILTYYYENDKIQFYKLFNSELGLPDVPKRTAQKSRFVTHDERLLIEQQWRALQRSDASKFPLSKIQAHKVSEGQIRAHKTIGRLVESVKRDGIYLTGEKAVRKTYKKIKK